MPGSPPVQFVYFDLDDTLLDHHGAERAALRETCQSLPALSALPFEEVHAVYRRHNAALWTAYAHGEIGRDELKRLRFERTLHELGAAVQSEVAGRCYMACYAQHWQLPLPAWKAFRRVAAHLPVGLLTNGFADVQRAKLARFPELAAALTALVISEEVGVMKPHRAIFDHAAALAGVAPEHLLYVGDALRSDIVGATEAGWQAAWYGGTPREAPEGVFCFTDWTALVAHLQRVAT